MLSVWISYESKKESCSVVCDSLWPHGLYSPWNSPGQNTGVVAFPFSRGSSHHRDRTWVSCIAGFFVSWATVRNPRVLEWVAYPFSSRSFWPRNWTGVSCVAGGFFTNWAIREALCESVIYIHLYPLLLETLPPNLPSQPSGSLQSTKLSSLC